MKVYRVSKMSYTIHEIEVKKETKDFYVIILGPNYKGELIERREKKETYWDVFFKDLKEAKEYVEIKIREQIAGYKDKVKESEEKLNKLLYDGENYVKKS